MRLRLGDLDLSRHRPVALQEIDGTLRCSAVLLSAILLPSPVPLTNGHKPSPPRGHKQTVLLPPRCGFQVSTIVIILGHERCAISLCNVHPYYPQRPSATPATARPSSINAGDPEFSLRGTASTCSFRQGTRVRAGSHARGGLVKYRPRIHSHSGHLPLDSLVAAISGRRQPHDSPVQLNRHPAIRSSIGTT